MTLTFPDFRGFVRAIVLTCTGIFLLQELLERFEPGVFNTGLAVFALTPALVLHGWVWQLVTYSFLHGSVSHILFNMLSLWFVGSYLETAIGARRVAETYFISVVGGGLLTVALFSMPFWHLDPNIKTIGASGGIFGLMVAFAVLFGDQSFYLFPLPFSMKAKYLVTIYIAAALLSFLGTGQNGVAELAHLGGALFGYVYIKLVGSRRPARGYATTGSETYYGLRNAFYRWKRKRAAKKFDVYMRRQDRR